MGMHGREEVGGAHDAALPDKLLAYLATGWARQPIEVTAVPHAELLRQRREALSRSFPGETLVIPTGNIRSRTFGAPYDFRAGSDFLWLVGDHDADSVVVFHPHAGGHDVVLYARQRSDSASGAQYLDRVHGEIWHGRRFSPEEKSEMLDIEAADLALLRGVLASTTGPTRILRGYDDYAERALAAVADDERDAELAAAISEMRMIKDAWEVEQLQEAVDATVLGFEDVARRLPHDEPTAERVVEGVFGWRARVNGGSVGYSSIVGSGEHSAILHWAHNTGHASPGDVLLMDMGVENNYGYTADITRVLPVSGRFTDVQREVYDIVYQARCAGLAVVAPGAEFREVHMTCMRVLAQGLIDLGILRGSLDEAMDPETMAYRRWTLHGFGHMLGLDVHDCGHARPEAYARGRLQAGQVLTMEPGLYLQPHDELVPVEMRGLGVRIEDDILVTAAGNKVLSHALPTASAEVESWLETQRQAGPRTPHPDDVS